MLIKVRQTNKPNSYGAKQISKDYMLQGHYNLFPDHFYVRYNGLIETGLPVKEDTETIKVCVCGTELDYKHKKGLNELLEKLQDKYPITSIKSKVK